MVDVGVSRHLAPNRVALGVNEGMEQRFNVLQVADLLDAEDDEMVPTAFVSVTQMTTETTEQIDGQPGVVGRLAVVERVDARLLPHDLFESFAEQPVLEQLARKASRHPLNQLAFAAAVAALFRSSLRHRQTRLSVARPGVVTATSHWFRVVFLCVWLFWFERVWCAS